MKKKENIRKVKKVLSILLVIFLLLSSVPLQALAVASPTLTVNVKTLDTDESTVLSPASLGGSAVQTGTVQKKAYGSWIDYWEVTATANPGYHFDHWEGEYSALQSDADDNPVYVYPNMDKQVTAVFVKNAPPSFKVDTRDIDNGETMIVSYNGSTYNLRRGDSDLYLPVGFGNVEFTASNDDSSKVFDDWDTSDWGSTYPKVFTPSNGDKYYPDANWASIPTYEVDYHGNNAPSDEYYIEGASVTVKDQGSMSYSHHGFLGWNTEDDGSGTLYAPGDTFTMPANKVDLYAQWGYLYDHIDVEVEGTLTIIHKIDGVTQSTDILDVEVSNPSASYVVGGVTYNLPTSAFYLDSANNEFRATGLSFFWPDSVTVHATLTDEDNNTYSVTHTFSQSEIQAAWELCPGSESSGNKGFDFVLKAEDITNTITNTVTFATDGNGTIGGAYADIEHTGILDGSDCPTPPTVAADSGYHFLGWTKNGGSTYLTTSAVDVMTINDDVTFTAVFEEDKEFRVQNFNGLGGDHGYIKVTYNGTTVNLDYGEEHTFVYYSTAGNVEADFVPDAGWMFNYYVIQNGATHINDDPDYIDPSSYAGQNGSNNMIKLNPKWKTAEEYTVTYSANGGVNAPTDTNSPYNGGTGVTVLGIGSMTNTGYTFLNWNTKSDGTGTDYDPADTFFMPANNVVLYAIWDANSYTVEYDKNNASATGTTADSTHVFDVAKNLTTNGYSLTGYTFNGWNTAEDGSGTAYTDAQSVTNLTSTDGDTVTLYAQWKANSYTVEYDKNNASATGTTANSTHVFDVAKNLTTNGYSLTGYTFNGWNTAEDGSGTAYTDAQSVTNLTSTDGDTVTLYAQWKANSYTVEYDKNNASATGTTADSTHVFDVAKNLTTNGYSLTGYTFNGWNTAEDGSGTAYTDAQSVTNLTSTDGDTVTLYAQWKANSYTVEYDKNNASATGTTADSTHVFDVAKNLTTNGYSLTGYTFNGWNTAEDGSGTAYTDAQSVTNLTSTDGDTVTLYAQWKANSYTVEYDKNNASATGTTADSTHVFDVAKNLTTNGYSLTGYTFNGWNTAEDGSGTAYTDAQSVTNLTSTDGDTVTLYAQWEAIDYDITYVMNGGTNDPTNPSSYTIEDEITLADPTQTGYTFAGWEPTDNIPLGSTGDKTFTATWEAIDYDITYIMNGGTNDPTNPSSYTIEDEITLADPTQTGYTFAGWEPTDNIPLGSTGDKTFTATWEINTYTVTWNDEDGTQLEQDLNVPYNTTPSFDSATPAKTATAQYTYTFAGWTPTVSAVTGDVTYTATYTETLNDYTVTWNNFNGVQLEQDTDVPYGTTPSYGGATPAQPATAQYTYTFAGWTPAVSAVTGDVIYTAQFTQTTNSYPVTFVNYNGVTLKVESVLYGNGATAPIVPARTGYTFTGWNVAFNNITGPLTVTAQFAINSYPYTVNYVDANGDPIADPTTATAAYTSTVTVTPIDVEGYTPRLDSQDITIDLTGNEVTFIYDEDEVVAPPETIEEPEVPLAGPAWALLNLILAIATLIMSIVLLVTYFSKKDKDQEIKRKGFWRVFSIVPAALAIITFILTEDMTAPMVFTDKWTLLMAAYTLLGAVVMVMATKKEQNAQTS